MGTTRGEMTAIAQKPKPYCCREQQESPPHPKVKKKGPGGASLREAKIAESGDAEGGEDKGKDITP